MVSVDHDGALAARPSERGAPLPHHLLGMARVDCAARGRSGAESSRPLCHLLCQVERPQIWLSPKPFMWALVHYYVVKLQHFSLNAISNTTILAAVCEGYLGTMPSCGSISSRVSFSMPLVGSQAWQSPSGWAALT